MHKVFYFILSVCIPASSLSQEYIGTWTSHLPYNSATHLTISGDRIFCVTQGGLFFYNKQDNSINKFSRENGLSDSEIATIEYSEENEVLVIAYSNANIDIIKENTIINLPDIKRKQIPGNKSINDIYFIGELAYLSCGFGIVVMDTKNEEIKETYFIGDQGSQVKVNELCEFENFLYAATDEGLFLADLNSPNLADFNYWEKSNAFNQSNRKLTSIISTGKSVYLNLKNENFDFDSIYWLSGNSWELYPYFQNKRIKSFNTQGNQVILSTEFHVDVYDENGNEVEHHFTGDPAFAGIDNEGLIWVADRKSGLIKIDQSNQLENLLPNGPDNINTASLEYENGVLIGVGGGVNASWDNLYLNGRIYNYSNNVWSSIKIDSLKDFIRVEIDPNDNDHYFVASWGYGLLEFDDGELINHFTEQNSTLRSIFPGDFFYRLGGIALDRDNNLWISNGGVAEPISVYTKDGDWISYPVASAVNAEDMADVLITQNNHKWITLPGGNGLFVFDDKGTLENPDDDEMKRLSVVDRNNRVITNEIYSIAEDRKGNIWLGTNKGIIVYYSPSRVFSGENFYAQQIIVPRNDGSGLGDPLLGSESVTTIQTDGANRKWIGTRNGGVFLVSEDGLQEIHAFNTDNSPLLSNSITDIAIDDESGEVFFATSKGIISYVSDATEPDDFFEDVYVYPNPVREDYQGDVVISGLMENTIVKITDLNGNLVHETISLGGQALWDGRNLNNERVSTGVYLVFCSTEDGSTTHVTKLLFIH